MSFYKINDTLNIFFRTILNQYLVELMYNKNK